MFGGRERDTIKFCFFVYGWSGWYKGGYKREERGKKGRGERGREGERERRREGEKERREREGEGREKGREREGARGREREREREREGEWFVYQPDSSIEEGITSLPVRRKCKIGAK